MGVTVNSWFEADGGCRPLAEMGPIGVSVTSWSEVGHCPLAELGQMGIAVTLWSEVDMRQCYLIV